MRVVGNHARIGCLTRSRWADTESLARLAASHGMRSVSSGFHSESVTRRHQHHNFHLPTT